MNILKIEVILLLSLVIGLWSLPGGCVEYMPLGRKNSVQRINEEVEGDQEVELPFEDIPYDDDEMNEYQIGCEECGIHFNQSWEYNTIVDLWNGEYYKNEQETEKEIH